MAMGKMVDLKRSKEAVKKNMSPTTLGNDDYSYGTRLSLGDHELSKLGIDKMPKVGDIVHVHAHAKVVGSSQHQRDGGKPERNVDLQIQKMRIAKDAENATDAMDQGIEEANE
jgi:hypothetical protein